jgi:uncharacterized protein (DUF362 family)
MENVVGVVKGTEKIACFQELLTLTNFDEVLLQAYKDSGKDKGDFKIVLKPNMMVFINPETYTATVTDKDLVEYLIDHLLEFGFSDISICDAQHDVGRMLKNHNVEFIADQIGYEPRGKYRIVDLTLESVPFDYTYQDQMGRTRTWADKVGKTWKGADFRITFAKCKTHEHDWMTLGVKNIYGCFPSANKINRYHIRYEVRDVTARSLRNFPIHFSFVDAWVASDGFQGYKIAHPRHLKMLFGGNDAIAVDMEIFLRAGLDPHKSRILSRCVEQLSDGVYPHYVVSGDQHTRFSQICAWDNIEDEIVLSLDVLEEVYIPWVFLNLRPAAEVDYDLFPPRSIVVRFLVCLSKKLYSVFKLIRFCGNLYSQTKQRFVPGGSR